STFDTKFASDIEVPEPLQSLPTMGGAGNVRELQQAAAQSGSVAGVLAQFQSATTRAEQKGCSTPSSRRRLRVHRQRASAQGSLEPGQHGCAGRYR
ncbi:MAG: hypothetical protein QM569_05710, partial [Acidovorax sp.]|uniref:hypothetical protein n=1 Tax=Acidovorax sp. TaxID=1872122 RepID=UPI0039E66F3F